MAQGRQFFQAGRHTGSMPRTGPKCTAGQSRKAVAALPGRVAQSALSPENTRQQLGIREASKGYGPAAGSEHTARMRPQRDICLHWDMCLQPALCSSLRVLSHYGSACQSSHGRVQHNSRSRVQHVAAGAPVLSMTVLSSEHTVMTVLADAVWG